MDRLALFMSRICHMQAAIIKTADEFDEIRALLESNLPDQKDHEEKLKEKIDAAFKDLAYIYRDLNW